MFVAATTIIIITAILYFTYWCISHKIKFQCMKNIPGPTPLPILGNALEFGFNPVDKLKNMARLDTTYGPLTQLWIGPQKLYLLVTDPDFTEFILNSPKYLKKADDYDILKPWLGNGLLLSTGSYWQKRRKMITTAFHFKILEDFISVFNRNGDILIKILSNKVDNDKCDIYPFVTAYTLDVIFESAMGTTVNAQENPNNEYVKAVKEMCHIFINRAFSPWLQPDFLFQYSNDFKRQTKALNIIHGFTNSVIEQRRKTLALNLTNNIESQSNDLGIKKKMAFLDLLLQAEIDGKSLSNNDIREEVDTFMFEGHDTKASSISFTLYELARNPHIQEKVVAELRNIFGNNKTKQPTLQDLNKMKYTELVLKEILRLYPSVPYYGRELEQDVVYNGTVFPKDLTLVLFVYKMHRNPKLFKNPNTFDPDRFLNDIKNPFSYVPFSAGPRNCIGQRFAMYEMKAIISKILRYFELVPVEPKHDIVLSGEVILKSDNGMSLRLRNR